ncbi:8-amino-7-oxononanoate synthase [Methylophilaceae bacterium]|jgi:8-amino-7-oxononanoate synthase|nr:8-amino-7-oxononanoate synthase [Methylophilaceae bacterium]|tara:strand:- start:3505 stop:4692 length:1188 start_codon:yes stop_codon:yes gene_type:complete
MMHQDLSVNLKDLASKKLYRQRKSIQALKKGKIKINNRWVHNFSSNDYLGLTQNKIIKKSIIDGIKNYGNGSGASHLISGHYDIHDKVENLASESLGFDKGILFSSGYSANIGVIGALCDRNDVIFSDRLNHASLNEASLLSKSKFIRYNHLDLVHLEKALKNSYGKNSYGKRRLIISDAVFSMDGDLINLPAIIDLCEKYDAYLYVDDAHGYGVLGKNGQGILEHYYPELDLKPKQKKRIIYMFTLGKSVGISGAIVLANKNIVNYLIQKARTYIYTTASSPAISCGILTSLRIVKEGKSLRNNLLKSIHLLREKIENKLLLSNSITPIQPILINDNSETIKISEKLFEEGFYVPAIRPPTVPRGTSRLRISISALHEFKDILRLAELINLNTK